MVCFITILCCICICAKCQSSEDSGTNRKAYAFSLLKDGNSFFDDDEKEIEIFRRPIDGNYFSILIHNDYLILTNFHVYMKTFVLYNLGYSPNEVTRPYFDDDNSSEGSDPEFIHPEQEWSDKIPRQT